MVILIIDAKVEVDFLLYFVISYIHAFDHDLHIPGEILENFEKWLTKLLDND